MAFPTLPTPAENAAFSAASMQTVLTALSFLNDQAPETNSGGDTSNSWATSSSWSDDPNLSVTLVVPAQSTVVVIAPFRWASSVVRATSLQTRLKYGSSYTTSIGEMGAFVANSYEQGIVFAVLTGVAAGNLVLTLSAQKNTAGDTVTIYDRYIYAIALPDGT
jgi:hypothetical protein